MKQKSQEVAMYCPVCAKGKVIVAANRREAERIRLIGPRETGKAVCFTKCRSCGSQIGVVLCGEKQEPVLLPTIGVVNA